MRLLDWVLIGITALLCGVSFWLMLTDLKAYRLANPPAEEEEAPKVLNKWVILYSAVMIVLTLGVAVAFGILYQANSFCFSLKRLSLLVVMWPLALIDAKTYRIPNRFILFGLICWAGIFVTELFVQYDGIWRRLLSEGIAAAALLLASMLCRLCAKNSIGYGDMKLFIVMGLMLGLNGIWGAVFASLVLSFLLAVFLLVTKKKSRKDVIPFAPAIVLGTFVSVFLTGM